MRTAIVVSSTYTESGSATSCPVFADTRDVVAERFGRTDIDFDVKTFEADHGLPEQLEAFVSALDEPAETMLLHCTGYVATRPGRGPALLLDGPRLRAFPFSRLGALIRDTSRQALIIVDAAVVSPPDATGELAEIAGTVADTLSGNDGHLAALVSVQDQPNRARRGPLRLTDLWLVAWEGLKHQEPGRPVQVEQIWRAMQQERLSFAQVPGATYRAAGNDLVLGGLDGHTGSSTSSALPLPRASELPEEAFLPSVAPPPVAAPRGPLLTPPPIAGPRGPLVTPPPIAGPRGPLVTPPPIAGPRGPLITPPPIAIAMGAKGNRMPSAPPLDSVIDSLMQAESPKRVLEVLQMRLGIAPLDPETLEHARERILQVAEPAEKAQWLRELAEMIAEPEHKAELLIEAAGHLTANSGSSAQILALLEGAVAAAPGARDCFDRAQSILAKSGTQQGLIELHDRALLASPTEDWALELALRLLDLHNQQVVLDSLSQAAVVRLIALVSARAELRPMAISLALTHGFQRRALQLLADWRRHEPRNPQALRLWLELGAGSEDAELLAMARSILDSETEDSAPAEHTAAREGADLLPSFTRSMQTEDHQRFFPLDGCPPSLPAVCDALAPLLTELQESNGGLPPRPSKEETLLDPQSSTTTLARSLAWTARWLGVDPPELFVLPELANHLAWRWAERPQLLLARNLGSGLGLTDLVFLGARHLALLRPDCRWRLRVWGVDGLASCLRWLSLAATPSGKGQGRGGDLEGRWLRKLSEMLNENPAFGEQARRLPTVLDPSPETCQSEALRYLRSVDELRLQLACSACDSPSVALRMTRRFPLDSPIGVEEQLDILARYATDPKCSAVRRHLGMPPRTETETKGI